MNKRVIELAELEHVDEDVLQSALADKSYALYFRGKPVLLRTNTDDDLIYTLTKQISWLVSRGDLCYVSLRPWNKNASPKTQEIVYACDLKNLFVGIANIAYKGWLESVDDVCQYKKVRALRGQASERVNLTKVLGLY